MEYIFKPIFQQLFLVFPSTFLKSFGITIASQTPPPFTHFWELPQNDNPTSNQLIGRLSLVHSCCGAGVAVGAKSVHITSLRSHKTNECTFNPLPHCYTA